MVCLIEFLNAGKGYEPETYYLAVNIADRYMRFLAAKNEKAPGLVLLALTSTIIAAKYNEFVKPCFDFTAAHLP